MKLNGVHTLIRRTHEDRVLRVLQHQGPMTRGEIADRVGLSRTTLSEITGDLVRRRAIVVVPDDRPRGGRGRPAELLTLDPNAGQFIGIDVAHRRIRVVVSNVSGEVVASISRAVSPDADWEHRIAAVLEMTTQVGHETGIHLGAVQGVGIGVPGPRATRLPSQDQHRPAWSHGYGPELMRVTMAERFDSVAEMDNNTRLAGLAEAIWDNSTDGHPTEARNLVYVRLSAGVGGSLVVDGRLVSGAGGLAGELGHISLDRDGAPCRCGKKGCLETVASLGAVLDACTARGVEVTDIAGLRTEQADGNPVVTEVLTEAGTAVGQVLGAVCVALDPAEIVIGGELAEIGVVVLEAARAALAREALPGSVPATLRTARLGDEGGAIGAIVALQHNSPLLNDYPSAPQGTRK